MLSVFNPNYPLNRRNWLQITKLKQFRQHIGDLACISSLTFEAPEHFCELNSIWAEYLVQD